MSFWENNKGTFKSAGMATVKGIGKGTKAVAKGGYSTYQNHKNKPNSAADDLDSSSHDTGVVVAPIPEDKLKSLPPPPKRNVGTFAVPARGESSKYTVPVTAQPAPSVQPVQPAQPAYQQPIQPVQPVQPAPVYDTNQQAIPPAYQQAPEQPAFHPIGQPIGQPMAPQGQPMAPPTLPLRAPIPTPGPAVGAVTEPQIQPTQPTQAPFLGLQQNLTNLAVQGIANSAVQTAQTQFAGQPNANPNATTPRPLPPRVQSSIHLAVVSSLTPVVLQGIGQGISQAQNEVQSQIQGHPVQPTPAYNQGPVAAQPVPVDPVQPAVQNSTPLAHYNFGASMPDETVEKPRTPVPDASQFAPPPVRRDRDQYGGGQKETPKASTRPTNSYNSSNKSSESLARPLKPVPDSLQFAPPPRPYRGPVGVESPNPAASARPTLPARANGTPPPPPSRISPAPSVNSVSTNLSTSVSQSSQTSQNNQVEPIGHGALADPHAALSAFPPPPKYHRPTEAKDTSKTKAPPSLPSRNSHRGSVAEEAPPLLPRRHTAQEEDPPLLPRRHGSNASFTAPAAITAGIMNRQEDQSEDLLAPIYGSVNPPAKPIKPASLKPEKPKKPERVASVPSNPPPYDISEVPAKGTNSTPNFAEIIANRNTTGAKPIPDVPSKPDIPKKPALPVKPEILKKPESLHKPEVLEKPAILKKPEVLEKPAILKKPLSLSTKPAIVSSATDSNEVADFASLRNNLKKSGVPLKPSQPPPVQKPASISVPLPPPSRSHDVSLVEAFKNKASTPPPAPPSRNLVLHVEVSEKAASPAPPPPKKYSRAAAPLPASSSIPTGPPSLDLELSSGWFADLRAPLPKALEGLNYTTSMLLSSGFGGNKRNISLILKDLSIIRYEFSWQGNNLDTVREKIVEFIPLPITTKPLSKAELIDSYEKYGTHVASWCQHNFDRTVGTGECWDLAKEALEKGCGNHAFVSTYYFHGYPILQLNGNQVIKGPFDEIRTGDILQFKSCKLSYPNGTVQTVGAPDHTSVVLLNENGELKVAEQNVNNVRKVVEGSYNLRYLETGEVTVFRPVDSTWAGSL